MKLRRILRAVNHYLVFFLLVAFVITCCTMLFVSVLRDTLRLELTSENIALAAKMTFINVVLLSLIFTVLDAIRRKFTVERPIREISDAAEKIVKGDFSVRIKKHKRFAADKSFGQIADCFNKMAEELGSVETLRTDFIANVSHEMKTPLAVMQNYASLLGTKALSDEKRLEYAKGISDASKRLSDMMTNILKLNRLENQQIFPDKTEFDLGKQLCECLLEYESVWERENIEIEADIDDGVIVNADKELLGHVWSNLFSNAFKFTPSGGKVSVSLSYTEHHATVRVSDTGCGMSSEVGAHIFEKFYRGDSSRSSRGNGLGLALVKRVIDICGGEIAVESTVGVGSTFTVRIRRA